MASYEKLGTYLLDNHHIRIYVSLKNDSIWTYTVLILVATDIVHINNFLSLIWEKIEEIKIWPKLYIKTL